MARGWESKAVESQVDAAAEEEQPRPGAKPQPTDAEKQNVRERDGLLLARKRIQSQMESSGNQRYTESLHLALAEIDAKLAKLG